MKVVAWIMTGIWAISILALFSELATGVDPETNSMAIVFGLVQIWINFQFIKVLDKKC